MDKRLVIPEEARVPRQNNQPYNTIPMSDDVLCIYLRKLVSNTIPMSDDVLCIYLRKLVSNTIPM